MTDRRDMLKLAGGGLLATGLSGLGASAAWAGTATLPSGPAPAWAKGFDGQRKADLGDGRFLNPIMAGDHPDPSILKDGADYYMTFSTFDSYPGLVIWHSRDLVNWWPIGPALQKNIGSVWAPELCKHRGRYYLYIPTKGPNTSWVIWADKIEGPWSEPVDLNLPNHIDPGHAVGEDGSRWLFLSGGDRVRLSDDGLKRVGEPEHVYDPWRYPADWVVEGFAPEGPKITRRGDYYYMVTAVGGTAGPPTGHMVIAARSKSIHGPWENCPANPLVHTKSAAEKMVVSRSCDARRRAGRRLVERLSRLREWLLDPRAPSLARSHRMDRRWLVPDERRRSVAADRKAEGWCDRGPARYGAVRRFHCLGARREMEFLQARGR